MNRSEEWMRSGSIRQPMWDGVCRLLRDEKPSRSDPARLISDFDCLESSFLLLSARSPGCSPNEGFRGDAMAFCTVCGAQTADGSSVCLAHAGTGAAQPVAVAAGGMTDNVAGMLAYVTFIPAIIFLVVEPYNKSRFVRFHAFQSIFLAVAVVIIQVALTFLTVVPFLILVTAPLHMLVALGALIVWIILLLKANQGQMYKLPLIGDLA